jgi:hypothetical protein
MEPINYLANIPNPAGAVFQGLAAGTQQQANEQQMAQAAAQESRSAEMQPFAVQGAQLGLDQGRQNMSVQADQNARANELQPLQVQAQQQQIAQRQQEQQRAMGFQSATADLAALGSDMTIADMQAIVTQYPEYGEAVVGSFQALGEAQQDSVKGVMAQAAFAFKNGNTATANDLIDEYVDAAEASGNAQAAATARAIQQTADMDPNAATAALGLALQAIDPDITKLIFDAGTDKRVQSTVAVGPTLSVQTMSNGDTRVVDTATNTVLTGQQAQDAIAAARADEAEFERNVTESRRTGTLGADIQLGGEAAASIDAAKIAQAAGLKAFEQVGSIRSNIGNIDRVIDAIDAGAKTGQLESRFPTWNAATIELRNLQNQLGLDVIGSVTFGALSEGELRLALNTALPTNLNETDLRVWLSEKKVAQEKLLSYMNEQARFLSRPGNTIAMWMDKVDAGAPDAPPATPTPSVQTAPAPAEPAPGGGILFLRGGQ